MSPSCNSDAARAAARLCSLSWKTDGGPTPGITFSSNSAADIIPQCANAPVQHLRPTGPLPPVRRRQALNLAWPTFVRGRRGGSAWPGGLRFGRRGYSEHRMFLVAGLPPYCTAPRQLHILPLLTRGMASQHSCRTAGFQPCPPLTAVPRWRVEWSGSLSFPGCWSGPHDLAICQIAPSPKLPENCDVCGD